MEDCKTNNPRPKMMDLFNTSYPGYDNLLIKAAEAARIGFPSGAVAQAMEQRSEMQRKIDKIMKPHLVMQEKIAEVMKPHLEMQKKIAETLQGFKIPEFQRVIDYGNEFRDVMKAREEKYPNLSKNLEVIASHSWFFSPNLSFRDYERLAFLLDGVENRDDQARILDEEFSAVYRDSFEYLAELILKVFPHRAFAILPAVDAHRESKFALSVPVFFSQAEGIIREITSAEMFTKTSKRFVNIADYANSQRDSLIKKTSWLDIIDDAVWAQLSIELPLAVTGSKHESGINRNLILHGMDLTYASELYSLKAFSLLCHAAGLRIDEESD